MTDIKRYAWKECDAHACRCDLVESASGDWVDYDDHIAALSQRDAQIAELTAENLDLKHPGTYLPSKRETPATDAAVNELRVEGVEMFAEHCRKRHGEMLKTEPNEAVVNQAITATRRAGEFALHFAARLREGK